MTDVCVEVAFVPPKKWQFREMPNFKKQAEDSDLQIATGKGGSVVRRVVLIVFLVGTFFLETPWVYMYTCISRLTICNVSF